MRYSVWCNEAMMRHGHYPEPLSPEARKAAIRERLDLLATIRTYPEWAKEIARQDRQIAVKLRAACA